MKYKELKKWFSENGVKDNDEILLGSDEELNNLFEDIQLGLLEEGKNREFVLYGLSGSEREETFTEEELEE